MHGTAIGTYMASRYVKIFTTDLEVFFIHSCPLIPLVYMNYIDDIIMWIHGKESLE